MFVFLSFLMCAIALFFGWQCWKSTERKAILWPRWRIAGECLGIVCLVWSAYHGCLMLEGPLARFHLLVWLLVPLTAFLSYFFLDYLFARSLGGIMVLLANELIRQAFIHDVVGRPLFSLVCLLLGVVGLWGIGAPWRYREVLVFCAGHSRWRIAASALFGLSALVMMGCFLTR